MEFFPDWALAADMCVANLRTATGKDPHDKGLHDLVGELSTRNDESAAAGEPTTSAPTAAVSSTSATTSSATLSSPTRASTCAPNPASP
jgi:hypothetical protein